MRAVHGPQKNQTLLNIEMGMGVHNGTQVKFSPMMIGFNTFSNVARHIVTVSGMVVVLSRVGVQASEPCRPNGNAVARGALLVSTRSLAQFSAMHCTALHCTVLY